MYIEIRSLIYLVIIKCTLISKNNVIRIYFTKNYRNNVVRDPVSRLFFKMRNSSAEVIVFIRNSSPSKQTNSTHAYKYGPKSDRSSTKQSAISTTLDRSKRSSVLNDLKKTSRQPNVNMSGKLVVSIQI